MMIQWESSHFFGGNTKRLNVAPACNSIVSPHDAFSTACEASCPAFTWITFPGAGVSRMAVCIRIRGNSAGPSKFSEAGFPEDDWALAARSFKAEKHSTVRKAVPCEPMIRRMGFILAGDSQSAPRSQGQFHEPGPGRGHPAKKAVERIARR